MLLNRIRKLLSSIYARFQQLFSHGPFGGGEWIGDHDINDLTQYIHIHCQGKIKWTIILFQVFNR